VHACCFVGPTCAFRCLALAFAARHGQSHAALQHEGVLRGESECGDVMEILLSFYEAAAIGHSFRTNRPQTAAASASLKPALLTAGGAAGVDWQRAHECGRARPAGQSLVKHLLPLQSRYAARAWLRGALRASGSVASE